MDFFFFSFFFLPLFEEFFFWSSKNPPKNFGLYKKEKTNTENNHFPLPFKKSSAQFISFTIRVMSSFEMITTNPQMEEDTRLKMRTVEVIVSVDCST